MAQGQFRPSFRLMRFPRPITVSFYTLLAGQHFCFWFTRSLGLWSFGPLSRSSWSGGLAPPALGQWSRGPRRQTLRFQLSTFCFYFALCHGCHGLPGIVPRIESDETLDFIGLPRMPRIITPLGVGWGWVAPTRWSKIATAIPLPPPGEVRLRWNPFIHHQFIHSSNSHRRFRATRSRQARPSRPSGHRMGKNRLNPAMFAYVRLCSLNPKKLRWPAAILVYAGS